MVNNGMHCDAGCRTKMHNHLRLVPYSPADSSILRRRARSSADRCDRIEQKCQRDDPGERSADRLESHERVRSGSVRSASWTGMDEQPFVNQINSGSK